MKLILIRHGETHSNLRHRLDTGAPGAPLTARGEAQARALPAALAGEQIHAIYRSHLTRTAQTAAPLVGERGLAPVVDPRVREILAGRLEMRSDHGAILAYHEVIDAWAAGDLGVQMPGAEDGHEVFGRYNGAIEEAHARVGAQGTAVFVSHGAIIRTWAAHHASNLDFELATRSILANTGIVALTGSPGDWMAETWMGESIQVSGREPVA